MLSTANAICERCSGAAAHWTDLPPVASEAGYHVYHCAACDHLIWIKWSPPVPQPQQPPPK